MKGPLRPNVILGVTNPFFCKTLQHWPHVLRLIDEGRPSLEVASASSPHLMSLLPGPGGSSKSQKVKKGGDLRTLDARPGLYTQYKAFLAKDKAFLKRLHKVPLPLPQSLSASFRPQGAESMRPAEAQSAIIRRHFCELTQSFMIPLVHPLPSPPHLEA